MRKNFKINDKELIINILQGAPGVEGVKGDRGELKSKLILFLRISVKEKYN